MKFRIVRAGGTAFTFGRDRYDAVLRPIGTRSRSEPAASGWRIRVERATLVLGVETPTPAIEVTVEGPIPERRASALVQEIAENIAAYTGEQGRVERL